VPPHDDDRAVAVSARRVDTPDAHVLERCDDAAHKHADLLVFRRDLDELDALDGPKTFVLVARTFGGPAALAFFDPANALRGFLGRFLLLGVPSIWHAGAIVGLNVFGLDLADAATVAKTADQPRATWLRVTGSDALADPRERPPINAPRRRGSP
jgi:hypothetical protein